jgi:hypothetical protein
MASTRVVHRDISPRTRRRSRGSVVRATSRRRRVAFAHASRIAVVWTATVQIDPRPPPLLLSSGPPGEHTLLLGELQLQLDATIHDHLRYRPEHAIWQHRST